MEERLQSFIRDSEEHYALPEGVSNIEFKLKNSEIKLKRINGVKLSKKPMKPLPRQPNIRPPITTSAPIPLPISTMTNNELAIANSELAITNNELAMTNNELAITNNELAITSSDLALSNNELAIANSELATNQLALSDNELPTLADETITHIKETESNQLKILDIINSPNYIVEAKDIEKKLSVSIEDLDSELDSLIEEVHLSNIFGKKNDEEKDTPKLSNMIVLTKNETTKKTSKKSKLVKASKRLPKYLREKFSINKDKLASPDNEMTLNANDIKKLNEVSLYNLRRINRAGPLPQIISVAITALDDKGRQVPLPDDLAKKIPNAINGVLPRDIPLTFNQGGKGGPVSEISLDMTNKDGKKERLRIKQCSIM